MHNEFVAASTRRRLTTRLLSRLTHCAAMLVLVMTSSASMAQWKSIADQMHEARVQPGSALERLVLQNQDFHLLRPEEASDTLPYPPWLRVHWRKAHPEGNYSADDPSGGY